VEYSSRETVLFILMFLSNKYYIFFPGVWFSIAGGLASYSFSEAVLLLLDATPKSLTYGEASVLTQSLILFLFTTANNLVNTWHNVPIQCVDTATVILQVRIVDLTTSLIKKEPKGLSLQYKFIIGPFIREINHCFSTSGPWTPSGLQNLIYCYISK
jgi:hypothetical protein